MEIFSVFSLEKQLIDQLIESFFRDQSIRFTGKDDDTIYFESTTEDKMAFYLHFENDLEEELRINYDLREQEFLKCFFGEKKPFLLDISYKDPNLLYHILSEFVQVIEVDYQEQKTPLLFHDPFEGFVEIGGMGLKQVADE